MLGSGERVAKLEEKIRKNESMLLICREKSKLLAHIRVLEKRVQEGKIAAEAEHTEKFSES